MSKHILTKSGTLTSTVTVNGRPKSVTAGSGNQFTVRYEDNPTDSHDVKAFGPGAAIPDSAEYLGTIGSAANTYDLYVL